VTPNAREAAATSVPSSDVEIAGRVRSGRFLSEPLAHRWPGGASVAEDCGAFVDPLPERGRAAELRAVNDLERLGYTERIPDERDERAKLVVPTERGRAAITAGARIVQGIEEQWAAVIGSRRLATLRELLLALNTGLWPD
jgi:hypothetical protein